MTEIENDIDVGESVSRETCRVDSRGDCQVLVDTSSLFKQVIDDNQEEGQWSERRAKGSK